MKRVLIAVPLGAALLLFLASTVRAQQPAANEQAATGRQTGSLVVEPIKSGWVIAPDVQVTKVNSLTRTLVGGYGGWQIDERLLLGGGAYWLADGSSDVGMTYGGGVVGWTLPLGPRFGVNARVLLGGGQATFARTFALPVPFDSDFQMMQDHFHGLGLNPVAFPRRFRFHQGFGVAEPQAGVVVHLNRWMAVNASGGYRFIGWAGGSADELRGAAGSLSLRLGAGS